MTNIEINVVPKLNFFPFVFNIVTCPYSVIDYPPNVVRDPLKAHRGSVFIPQERAKILCKRMLISGNWFQPINLICFRTVHRMPKIPILLQAQPEIRGHTQNTGKAQGRIRSYRTSAFNNFVQPRVRNAQATSEFCLCKPQRLDEFLEKHLSGMCRWTITGQPPSNISGNL